MAWQDWEDQQRAELWKTVLDLLEMQIRSFVEQAKLGSSFEVTKATWDQPNVELRWSWEGNVWRNVNVEVLGHDWPLNLRFSGSVWCETPNKVGVGRKFKYLQVGTVRFNDLEDMGRRFEDNLEGAVKNVLSLGLPEETSVAFAD